MFYAMTNSDLSHQIKALGDPTRLRIVEQLPALDSPPCERSCRSGYNVSQLAEKLDIPQPTVSHHLKALYLAGIVKKQKLCRDRYYWVDQTTIKALLAELKTLCEA